MEGLSDGRVETRDADDIGQLVAELLDEVKALRVENARLLAQLDREGGVARRVGVQDGDRHRLLKASEIAYLTPKDDELQIFTTDGKRHVNALPLNEIEKRFSADLRMLRVHKSYLVNLDQVRAIWNSDNGRLLALHGFPDETTVPVSYDYIPELERRLGVGADARS